ncbi:tetratricopeptide repeat protein [Candidatus Sumerlaeota bacterium]|nr:tetratricopeptide repeat protein [Candidatus Sumerlaeota bacterium]
MGRFSKLERETQDALARQKIEEIREGEKPKAAELPREEYDAPYYIKMADDLFFRGEFREALQFYSRAIQLDSSIHYPWLGQIYCLIEMNQLKEADLWTGRALELFPEDSALLSLRAMMYANRGMYKRAINASDYAISRKGVLPHSYVARGYILLTADNKNAHFCFMKALELADSNDFRIPMSIGLIYLKRKQYSKALDFLLRACACNVANYFLWHHMGLCYQKLGFTNKAMESFQHALDQNPEYTPAKDALLSVTHSSVFSRLFRRLIGIIR